MKDLKQAGAAIGAAYEKGALQGAFPTLHISQIELLCGDIVDAFIGRFGMPQKICLASVPGSMELLGSCAVPQGGLSLWAATTRGAFCCAAKNGDGEIRLFSTESGAWAVNLSTEGRPGEAGTPAAAARGVAEYFAQTGFPVGGFDAYIDAGDGFSAATLGVLLGTLMNDLFCAGAVSPLEVARAARHAQKGVPDGAHLACALGGAVLADPACPAVPALQSPPPELGETALCLVDTGAQGHSKKNLLHELERIAGFFGKQTMADVGAPEFFCEYARLRASLGDQATLYAYHFLLENDRVRRAAQALEQRDAVAFLSLAGASGRSAIQYLYGSPVKAAEALPAHAAFAAFAACEYLLGGRGALRVQSDGALLACVPADLFEKFQIGVESMLGSGRCQTVAPRPLGAAVIL